MFCRRRLAHHSYENIVLGGHPRLTRGTDSSSYESLKTNRSSQSSGYRSEIETELTVNAGSEQIWVKQEKFVVRTGSAELNGFERTRSLDNDDFTHMNKTSRKCSSALPSSGELVRNETLQECRPRTYTIPQASPKIKHVAAVANRTQLLCQPKHSKPVPTPRKRRPNVLNVPSLSLQTEHIYDDPSSLACDQDLIDNFEIALDQTENIQDADVNVSIKQFSPYSPEKKFQESMKDTLDGPVYAQVNKVNK